MSATEQAGETARHCRHCNPLHAPEISRLRNAGHAARPLSGTGPLSGLDLHSSVCKLSKLPAGTPASGQVARLQLLRHSTLSCCRVASICGCRASGTRGLLDRSTLPREAADCSSIQQDICSRYHTALSHILCRRCPWQLTAACQAQAIDAACTRMSQIV